MKRVCLMIKKIDHMVITTSRPQDCLKFYEKLGFDSRDAGGRYELYAGDFKINVHIRGSELHPHARNIQPGSADICFETEVSLAELKEKLEKADLEIELGIVDRTGVKGPMESIYLRDPDGNLIEISSYGSGR